MRRASRDAPIDIAQHFGCPPRTLVGDGQPQVLQIALRHGRAAERSRAAPFLYRRVFAATTVRSISSGSGAPLEPFPSRLNQIVVIASEAWRSSGSDSNEPVAPPRFARDDGVFS
jgi:hypothetical protein